MLPLLGLGAPAEVPTYNPVTWNKVIGVLSTVSAALSAYHGYRRNQSVAWGVAWFVLGGAFPIITPTIALAQGFGKKAS